MGTRVDRSAKKDTVLDRMSECRGGQDARERRGAAL